jgi:hypothetical protein
MRALLFEQGAHPVFPFSGLLFALFSVFVRHVANNTKHIDLPEVDGMKFRYALVAFTAILLTVLHVPVAAQATFSLELKDTSAVVGPGSLYNFQLYIHNNSANSLDIVVNRIVNDLPSASWFTNICTGDLCYDQSVSITDPVRIAPGGKADVKLSVVTGQEIGKSADIVLRFDGGLGVGSIEQGFHATVAASGIGIDNPALLASAPYPNPAATQFTLRLAEPAANVSLRLFDPARGTMIDMRDRLTPVASGLSVDLAGISSGTYIYRLNADGETSTGSIVVVR